MTTRLAALTTGVFLIATSVATFLHHAIAAVGGLGR